MHHNGVMETNETMVRMTLRLPTDVNERLEQRAKKYRRSKNDEIIMLLDRFLDTEEGVFPPEKHNSDGSRTAAS